jgi:formylglycine-generating enzyme required for sulfatase activity
MIPSLPLRGTMWLGMLIRAAAILTLVACGDGSARKPTTAGDLATVRPSEFKPRCETRLAPLPAHDAAPMCVVPAGEFTMGTPVEEQRPQHGPARRVHISKAFYLDQFEVTNEQYATFLRAGSSRCGKIERFCFGTDHVEAIDVTTPAFVVRPGFARLPASVTFDGADAYCAWAGKRLPTEAEWEFAARHDPASGHDRVYPWGDAFRPGVTNHFGAIDATRGRRAEVGTFREDRAAIGAYDLGGNAAEWVADCFSTAFTCAEPCTDPLVSSGCEQICSEGYVECEPGRLLKGGDYMLEPEFLHAKRRDGEVPRFPAGIRCAVTPTSPAAP